MVISHGTPMTFGPSLLTWYMHYAKSCLNPRPPLVVTTTVLLTYLLWYCTWI